MIETARLILRAWRDADAAAHHAMCNDPRVAASLGGVPTIGDSRDVVTVQNARLAAHGHCFWAAESRADGRFVGWCGIQPGKPPIVGEIEIGWALLPELWGQGLAHEAAAAVLAWTWAATDHAGVVAITSRDNVRSRRLMERLGMLRDPGADFDHPELAPGDPLRRHVLYRCGRPAA
jgi:RimJ/RimL family protein N-acetyltransferase